MCQLCGRVHFATAEDAIGYAEGELEGLRQAAEKEPDKYVEDAFSTGISWGYIDGKTAVVDCPCNGLYKYERWILNHVDVISRFLRSHARNLQCYAGRIADAGQAAEDVRQAQIEATEKET
jgi:hypothetical protein